MESALSLACVSSETHNVQAFFSYLGNKKGVMFPVSCEKSLGKIKFGTSELYSGRKKKKNLNQQKSDGRVS